MKKDIKKINTNKMSVVFLDFDDIKNPLLNGGQARATFEVGKRFVDKGHKFKVLTSKFPGYKDRVESGIEYKHIGLGTKNVRINNFAYILSLPLAVAFERADIIVECFTAPISTLFSPIFTRTPVVIMPSSFEADRFSQLYGLPFNLVEKLGMKFYKYGLPYTDVVDAKIKRMNPKVITKIVAEGVGKQFFEIKKRTPKHLMFLARFDMSQKGMDLLLKAYASVADKIKFPLIIAGAGPDENKIWDLIKNLNLSKRVKMIGPTYGVKKAGYLSEALAIAVPSRDETFSLFALETLASGNAMIKFDIPGLRWTGEEVVMKCKPFDIQAYGQLLLKAAKNIKATLRIGAKAREFARNFSWEKVADNYEEFFYEILKIEGKK